MRIRMSEKGKGSLPTEQERRRKEGSEGEKGRSSAPGAGTANSTLPSDNPMLLLLWYGEVHTELLKALAKDGLDRLNNLFRRLANLLSKC
jgi:hypothetical protein